MQPGSPSASQTAAPDTRSAVDLVFETFAPCRGERFELAVPGGGTLDAVLDLVTPGRISRGGAGRQAFSLLFRVPHRAYLPQGLYVVRHPGMDPQPIFLVPVTSQDSILRMEAVFN